VAAGSGSIGGASAGAAIGAALDGACAIGLAADVEDEAGAPSCPGPVGSAESGASAGIGPDPAREGAEAASEAWSGAAAKASRAPGDRTGDGPESGISGGTCPAVINVPSDPAAPFPTGCVVADGPVSGGSGFAPAPEPATVAAPRSARSRAKPSAPASRS
jgi:hypothetical protein